MWALVGLEFAWHPAETNMRCAGGPNFFMFTPNILAFIVSKFSAFILTDGQLDRWTWLDRPASAPAQVNIYFMGLDGPMILGWSDKYSASKRKTKILKKWQFISQHNLLLARYT